MNIIAKTDIYDNDGNLATVVKLGKRLVSYGWQFVTEHNSKIESHPDKISAVRHYGNLIEAMCYRCHI